MEGSGDQPFLRYLPFGTQQPTARRLALPHLAQCLCFCDAIMPLHCLIHRQANRGCAGSCPRRELAWAAVPAVCAIQFGLSGSALR
jgi:hypothetical protein